MSKEISQRELRNDSGAILRAVQAGETFVITSNGTPVAQIAPLRRRTFVDAQTVVEAFAGLAPVDYQELLDDLDAVADPSPRW